MPRPLAKLSNCYSLLPLPSDVLSPEQRRQTILKSRDSGDGRSAHALRRLFLESGRAGMSNSNSDEVSTTGGSALMELGHTKVFCHVTAPTTSDALLSQQTKELSMDQGILLASVQYAPFAYPASHLASSSATPMGSNAMASEHNAGLLRSTLTARQAELAAKITTCLQAVVPLQHYPKTAIHLQLTILQDDGHVLTACLTAASLALVDASVEVHDVVACGSVSGFHHTVSSNQMIFLADPDWMEYHAADASMTLAMLPNLKQVILWEQTGRMSPREANQAMELCRDGCRTLHRFVRQHMIDTTTSNSI